MTVYRLIPGIDGAQGAFAIHVDHRGDAWVATTGRHDKLFVARSATGGIESFDHALPTMSHQYNPGEPSAYQDASSWRWGQSIDGERFLFTMADMNAPYADRSGGSLWEFDASNASDGDLSDAFREVAWIGGNNLGITYDEGTVYFVRRSDGFHDPKIDAVRDNGRYWDPAYDSGVRLHLYSISVNDPAGTIVDWGEITDAEGRVPWRIESLSADTSAGRVYMTGDWVMKEDDPVTWRTQRHSGQANADYTLHIRGQAFAVADLGLQAPAANLDITKSDAVTTVHPGETLTYVIAVTNNGPQAANDVVVTDFLPAEIVGVGWIAVGIGGASGFQSSGSGDIHDTGIRLPAGAKVTYTVTATVAAATLPGTTLINTATANDSTVPDPDIANNSATDSDTQVVAPSTGQTIYFSSAYNGRIGGVTFENEDIFTQNTSTGAWSLFFDGSDVGVTTDVDAFHRMADGSVLMSFNTHTSVAGVGTVLGADIVRFIPTSTGPDTAGSFEMYFVTSLIEANQQLTHAST